MHKTPIMLVILDGFGYSKQTEHNAVFLAHTPHLDYWKSIYPYTYINASGVYVGLPPQTIGNSEVGHLTIGTGRVIKQPFTIINEAIASGILCSNHTLSTRLAQLKQSGGALHIMGLLSDAGVHAHIDHIIAYLSCAAQYGIQRIFVHAFLDGRDVASLAPTYLEIADVVLKKYGARFASIHGRFFAMDRDNNWERTLASYEVLTTQLTHTFLSWQAAVDQYYAQNITDEFIPPIQLNPDGIIHNGDGIIFANFRPDRARQLTTCFVDPEQVPQKIVPVHPLFFIIPTEYASNLTTDVLFPSAPIVPTLKEILSNAGKTILAIAETEKYAHVTYFFDGEREAAFPHEQRIFIPSKKLHDYRTCPQMSAPEITHTLLEVMHTNPKDFYLVNFANADMVGHSGDLEATIQAVGVLDRQLGILYNEFVIKRNGIMIITVDHGKAEDMFNEHLQKANTAHTNNPVLFMCLTHNPNDVPDITGVTQLADIAPFILHCFGLKTPEKMLKK